MSRDKLSILEDAVSLLREGNSLRTMLAALQHQTEDRRKYTLALLALAEPDQIAGVMERFSDRLNIECRIKSMMGDLTDLEYQLASMFDKTTAVKLGLGCTKLQLAESVFLAWTRPRMDLLISLLKGRIRLCTKVIPMQSQFYGLLNEIQDYLEVLP